MGPGASGTCRRRGGLRLGSEDLASALAAAVEASVGPGEKVALGFSGGLDSSLLALLLLRRARPRGYVVGVPGCHDIAQAIRAAHLLSLPLRVVELEEEWVEAHLPRLFAAVPDSRTVAFELPLYRMAAAVEEPVIVTGQGADEIFGGYQRYLRVPPQELPGVLAADVDALLAVGMPREEGLLAHFGRTLRCPYLHPAVVGTALALPPEARISGGVRKVALREAARSLGLPPPLADQPKKALQYGSGTSRMLRAMARRRGTDVGGMVRLIRYHSG